MSCVDSHGQAAACLFRCFSLSHVSTSLCFISPSKDGSAVDVCAIQDTTKLLNDDAALELFVCNIVALAAVVSCVRKTHIGCISVFLRTLFTTTRLLRRLRHCPGRLLYGGGVAASPEGTAREAPRRCLVHDPGHHKAAGRRRSVAVIAAGLGCEDMPTRHVAALVFLLCVSVSPCGSVLVLRGGTPGGCCAWAPGVCHRRSRVGELPRHTP